MPAPDRLRPSGREVPPDHHRDRYRRAIDLAVRLPKESCQRLSAGTGAKGERWYELGLAAQMRQTLRRARRAVDAAIDAGASNLPPATLGQLRGLYANTAEQGVAANAPGVKGASKEAYKLANRIDQALYFTVAFDVDWTNNSCEQAIRMAKLQAKISGSWRSMRGLKAFCRIRSYIATARAHGVPVFTALRDAFLDSPWGIPTTA